MDTKVIAPSSIKKRRKRAPKNAASSYIICSKSSNNHAIEIGLAMSLFILCLYFYGFVESIQALPDVPSGMNKIRHLGGNLNLAKEEWTEVEGSIEEEGADTSAHAKGMAAVRKSIIGGTIQLPKPKWPASVRDEDGNFETILHPGDGKTTLSVPKFWSPPVHNGILMTRETALKVGTCNEPDAHGNIVRGDDCPADERTIYFAIASYRDFQCRYTIESAFMRAKNPKRIRIGKCKRFRKDCHQMLNYTPLRGCGSNRGWS